MSADDKRFYTVNEAAYALALSRTTIYNLMGAGKISFVYFGSKRLIPADSIQKFADALMRGERRHK